ncbi:hypothetical protein [Pseudobacillus wudalianchiensis]|uniref:hypothetical protein n=1 Tax=Pseudobacillus wudalianchiensis TaxID=1743143 RepID=UPI00159F27C3|nr:hypothetical protein [Bacillus wudalianchiensis]
MSLTYKACKSMIDRQSYTTKEDMQSKLDIFLLNNRLTQVEYDELSQQIATQ